MKFTYYFLIRTINITIRWLNVGVFEHNTLKSKLRSFLLVRRYRLQKFYMYLKWDMKNEVRHKYYQSLIDFFTPDPNLPYTLWDIKGYLKKKYYLNSIRRMNKIQAKFSQKLSKETRKRETRI